MCYTDEVKIFDVIYADLDGKGSEQKGLRPCVVIQNDIGNKYSKTVIIIPFTSHLKKTKQPTHLVVQNNETNGLTKMSMLLAENLTVISKERIKDIVGRIEEKDVQKDIIDCYIANITGRKNNGRRIQ